MPSVKWTVNSIEGEPTPEGARRVNLSAWYEVADEFADQGRGVGVSFEVWVPASLRDLDAITREVGLAGALSAAPEIVAGKMRGRVVVNVNA